MSIHKKSVLSAVVAASLVLAGTLSAEMLPQRDGRPQVLRPVKMDVSPALRDIPVPAAKPSEPREIRNRTTSVRPDVPGVSANIQTAPGVPNTPDPLGGWVGLGSDDNSAILGTRFMPPDTQGDVGKDHYVQWINSIFAIWDKAGNKVYPAQPGPAAAPGNVIWSGFGGRCESDNDGDPITLWDPLAERWVMSQFAVSGSPFTQCVAVSTTSDPTGTWYRYAYAWPNTRFPDYPKLGVWPDGYYITTNDFNSALTAYMGVTVGAFERDKMLVGDPAGFIYFQTGPDRDYSVLPADLDGTNPPPVGAPGLIGEFQDKTWIGTANDQMWLFELNLDWANPGASTFGVGATNDPNYAMDITDVSANCSGRDCVPQGPSAQMVDDIDFRLMHRLAYTNLGSSQAIVGSMTVGAGGRAGVWWGELQSPNAAPAWTLRQDGVYAPADSDHRWMPSVAMDINGNIMLGYSASSTTVYPSVRYVGRLAGDPLGQMGDEKILVVGAGAQSGGNRWGDYSMMSVDPTDGCTFWFTQEYVAVSGNFDWDTYIGNMKFSSCTAGPAGVIEGYVKSTAGGAAIAGASVQIGPSYSTTTNALGFYQVTVPVGTYDVTASKFGFDPASELAQEVTEGATTVVADLMLTPAGAYAIDGFVTAAEHNWPLWARIEIRQAGNLVETVYTSPWNGYYEIAALPNGYTYDFTVHSMYQGYLDEVRPVTVASGDQVQNFTLLPASGNPAYACTLEGGINENFEGGFPPLGWTVKNNGSNPNYIWKRNDAWGINNRTGGTGYSAAIGSHATSSTGPYDSELWSPLVSMPATPRMIRFASNFQDFAANGDAYFDISTNGGGTWTTLLSWTVDDPTTGVVRSANLTAYAGQTVVFRWRFVAGATTTWGWQIDDVWTETIPPPQPPPLFTESFDGTTFPPTGWTVVNADAGGTTWTRSTATTHSGAGVAYHNYSSAGMQDGWLVTPAIAVPAGGAPFTFWEYTTFPADYFKHSLWACTSACTTPPTNFTQIAEFTAPTAAYRQQTVSLNAYANGNVTLAFRYEGDFADAWRVDDVVVPSVPPPPVVIDMPTLVCNSVAGSLVAGFVTDANTTDGIPGATVARDLGGVAPTMAATGNLPAGFYYMFSPGALPNGPNGPSTRTFTASKDGYGPVAHAVNLIPDTVNRLDFVLPAASLSLGGWPFVVDGFLTPDGLPVWDKTQLFSILNTGGLSSELKLSVTGLPMTFPHMFPAFVPDAPTVSEKTSFGPAQKPPVASNARKYPGLAGPLATIPAFGVDLIGDGFVTWPDASVPGAWTVIAPATQNYYAGDFLGGDFSKLYLIDNAALQLHTRDTATGAVTVIGPATPPAGESWTGLTGSSDGNLYASSTTCSASTLTKINPATGEVTTIGPITNGACVIDIAANAAGEIYGIDIIADTLLQIDPATGAGTVIGPLGANANYAQGMDFEEESGTLYWAAYTTGGELRTIDTATGASFLVGAFPGGTEVDAYAIASGGAGGGVPWLTLTPTEGTVPAAGQLDINAEFFPEGVNPAHYGLFRGVIKSTNDTPNALPDIPVFFTKGFWDVPRDHWASAFIHSLAGARVTRGCGSGNYCPEATISRAEMAVTMVRAMYGPDYGPPPAIGIFADVEISDTDTTADYIEQLYNDGVVAGCSAGPPALYCPTNLVNRAEMSVFVAAALGITPVVPPTGYFTDVTGTPYSWAAPFAEALFNAGITAGCGDHIFCPATQITRAQLAVWLVTTLGLPYYTHPLAP